LTKEEKFATLKTKYITAMKKRSIQRKAI